MGIRPTSVLLHNLSVLEQKRVVEFPPQVLDDEMREEAKEESDEEEERKEGKGNNFPSSSLRSRFLFGAIQMHTFWANKWGRKFYIFLE